MNKKKMYFIISFSFLLLIIISIVIFASPKKFKSLDAYKMLIRIQTVDASDKEKDFTIIYKSDGRKGVAELNYFPIKLYLQDKNIYYKEGNRFKNIKLENNYSDVYDIIKSISLKGELRDDSNKKVYNPEVEENTINKILEAIILGKNTKSSHHVYVTTEKDFLKEFNLTLNDIDNYKTCNITISFEKLENIELETFKPYKNLTDEIAKDTLKILE